MAHLQIKANIVVRAFSLFVIFAISLLKQNYSFSENENDNF